MQGEEEIQKLELEIYNRILNQLSNHIEKIQKAAESIAILDCLITFAELAETYNYVKPMVVESGEIHITEGRHPVIETTLGDEMFVPNDTEFNVNKSQLHIITGPNMAGKSVYIRQVALIFLLNQIGSFVPARNAELSIVDRIFVRSGASDMISEGLSTFMVEMVETAQILHRATNNSLVIMDEIGRGTSTYDGISIAWAIAEYLVNNKSARPKTLFATHYHELQELETKFPNKIKNYHMAVEDENNKPIFLYTLLEKGASHSYGIAVAKLAGLPQELVDNAYHILSSLEKRDNKNTLTSIQKKPETTPHRKIIQMIRQIDINTMTPMEALQLLSELKKQVLNICQ